MQPPAPMEGLAYYTQSLLALWPDKALVGSCVAGVVSLFGGDVYLLWMLAVMMVADFAFGVADAARRRHFRCRMLWHGLSSSCTTWPTSGSLIWSTPVCRAPLAAFTCPS